jgi:hypothetical protein
MHLENNPHQIHMPQSARRDGYLIFDFLVTPRVTIEAIIGTTNVEPERTEIAAALPSAYNGVMSFGYQLAEGINAVDVHISYNTGGRIVEGMDFADALASFLADVDGIPFIVSVATLSRDEVESGTPRSWVFHFVKNKPTIKVDGDVVVEPGQ